MCFVKSVDLNVPSAELDVNREMIIDSLCLGDYTAVYCLFLTSHSLLTTLSK